jgi:hypothetical protein
LKAVTNTVSRSIHFAPRHWQLISTFFIVSLPILVKIKEKPQLELCSPLELDTNSQLLYEMTL